MRSKVLSRMAEKIRQMVFTPTIFRKPLRNSTDKFLIFSDNFYDLWVKIYPFLYHSHLFVDPLTGLVYYISIPTIYHCDIGIKLLFSESHHHMSVWSVGVWTMLTLFRVHLDIVNSEQKEDTYNKDTNRKIRTTFFIDYSIYILVPNS